MAAVHPHIRRISSARTLRWILHAEHFTPDTGGCTKRLITGRQGGTRRPMPSYPIPAHPMPDPQPPAPRAATLPILARRIAADIRDWTYHRTTGWPWRVNDTDVVRFPWRGLEGHNGLKDRWPSRARNTRIDPRAQAQRNREEARDLELYAFPVDGCASKPFCGSGVLATHLDNVHEEGQARANRRAKAAEDVLNRIHTCGEEGCSPKPFGNSDFLTRHLAFSHNIVKEGSTYPRKQYNRHRKAVIASDRFLCAHNGCPNAISGQGLPNCAYFRRHLRAHELQARPIVQLPKQPKRKTHIFRRKTRVLYRCDQRSCTYWTRATSDMLNHITTHADEKNFHCNCSKS